MQEFVKWAAAAALSVSAGVGTAAAADVEVPYNQPRYSQPQPPPPDYYPEENYRQPPRNYGYREVPPPNYGYREPPPDYREVPPPNYAYRAPPPAYTYEEEEEVLPPAYVYPPRPAYRYYRPPVVRVVPPIADPYFRYRRDYSYRLHGPRIARESYVAPRGYRNWSEWTLLKVLANPSGGYGAILLRFFA